jgi:hypothetical protein
VAELAGKKKTEMESAPEYLPIELKREWKYG